MHLTATGHNDGVEERVHGHGTPQRRCIVTRAACPTGDLLRFVVGPDGRLVADVAGNLPGRGLWVTARREMLDLACRRNLFQAAARRPVEVPANLADAVEAIQARRCLDILGLARRAGEVVAGFEKVRAWLRANRVAVLVAAADGAAGGREKLRALADGQPVIDLFSASELGGALGRDSLIHVAVAHGGLAARLVVESARLAGWRNLEGQGKVD